MKWDQRKWCSRLKKTGLALVRIYFLLFVILILFQGYVVFPGQWMVFPSLRHSFLEKYLEPCSRTFHVNGETLEGWVKHVPGTPLIVFLGGNGEDVAWHVPFLDGMGCSFLTVNYRGFGNSSGSPSEQALIDDAIVLIDQVCEEMDIPSGEVVLVGQSIGSGVAVAVASKRPPGKLVLQVPFDSLEAVAKEKLPVYPVSWILRSPFRSDLLAPAITCPVAVFAVLEDEVIPVHHARRIASLFPQFICYREFDGVHHMELEDAYGFERAFRNFCLGDGKG